MSPRTSNKKRSPVKVTFTKSKLSERTKLFNVYRAVLLNWAISNVGIERITKLDAKEVKRLTMKLARTGLLEGTHVNSERTITWQTMYDVENDANAIRNGERDFAEMFPKDEPAKSEPAKTVKPKTKTGATGARYTDDQLTEAIVERLAFNASWKEVAATVGVKSPFHFSKVVRANWKRLKPAAKKEIAKQAREALKGAR
jgi:hypothetical protein